MEAEHIIHILHNLQKGSIKSLHVAAYLISLFL